MLTLSPPRPAPAGLPGTHGGRDRVSRTSGGGLRSRAGRLWPCGSHSRCHSLCRVCLPRPLPLVSAASSPLAPPAPQSARRLPAPQPRPGHRARPGNAGRGGRGLRGSIVSGFQPTAQRRTSHRGTPTTEKKHHFPNRESTFYFRLGVSNLDGPRIAWGSGRSAALDPGGLGQGRRRWVLNQLPATPTLLAGRPPASVQDLANKRKITRMTNQLWVCLPMCHILLPVRISC